MGPDVDLDAPGRALLGMEIHVDAGDTLDVDEAAFGPALGRIFGKRRLQLLAADAAVDDDMADMDALRPKLLRALCARMRSATKTSSPALAAWRATAAPSPSCGPTPITTAVLLVMDGLPASVAGEHMG